VGTTRHNGKKGGSRKQARADRTKRGKPKRKNNGEKRSLPSPVVQVARALERTKKRKTGKKSNFAEECKKGDTEKLDGKRGKVQSAGVVKKRLKGKTRQPMTKRNPPKDIGRKKETGGDESTRSQMRPHILNPPRCGNNLVEIKRGGARTKKAARSRNFAKIHRKRPGLGKNIDKWGVGMLVCSIVGGG